MVVRKQRDSTKTKEAILVAAALKFTEKGYDAAGVREIADEADVNIALINRYFGSKEGLFEAAVIPHLEIDALLIGDTASLAGRIAHFMIGKNRPSGEFDPMLAILRSAGNETVGSMIKRAFDNKVIPTVAGKVSKENAKQRAALIVAILFGFDSLNRIIGVEAIREGDIGQLEKLLKVAIDSLV